MSKYVVGEDDGDGGDAGGDDLDSLSDQDQDQDQEQKGTGARIAASEDDEDDEDEDFEDSSEQEEEDEEDEEVQADGENMDYWMQLAKQEIDNQAQSSVKVLSPSVQQTCKIATSSRISPLVDYGSSSSDDEDEVNPVNLPAAVSEGGMTEDLDQSDSGDDKVEAEEHGQNPPSSSSHQLGDGGALNSVHLLWICKRGRAESLFEAWRSMKAK